MSPKTLPQERNLHSCLGLVAFRGAARSCGALNLGLSCFLNAAVQAFCRSFNTCSMYEVAGNGHVGAVLTMPDADRMAAS